MSNVKLIVLLFSAVLYVCSASGDYKSANLKLGFDLLEDPKGGSSIRLRSFKESEERKAKSSSESSSSASSSDLDLRKKLDSDEDAPQDSIESDKAETSNEKVYDKSESYSDERRERSTIGLRSAESGDSGLEEARRKIHSEGQDNSE